MGSIIKTKNSFMRLAKILAGVVFSLLAFYVFIPIIFSVIWIERQEFLGLKHGMTQQEVIDVLARSEGIDVLPRLETEITITKKNIDTIERLMDASGICITSHKIDLQVSFDREGRVTKAHYGSVRKFTELSEIKSKEDLLAKSRLMIERFDGLEVSACIPEVQWIRVSETTEKDKQYLAQYSVWLFDEPNSYSGVRLVFVEGRLSKIEYKWHLYEPL
jgi:hypothetical protein